MLFLQKKIKNKSFLTKIDSLNNIIIKAKKQNLTLVQSTIEDADFFSSNADNLEGIGPLSNSSKKIFDLISKNLIIDNKKELLRFYNIQKHHKRKVNVHLGNKDFVESFLNVTICSVLYIINKYFYENKLIDKRAINCNDLIKNVFNHIKPKYIYSKYSEHKKTNIKYKKNIDFFAKSITDNLTYPLYLFINLVLFAFENLKYIIVSLIQKTKILLEKRYFIDNSLFDADFLLSKKDSIPMLINPKKWSITGKNGGYLSNKHGLKSLTTGLLKGDQNITLNNAKEFLKIINEQQKVKFSINKKILNYIKINFDILIESKLIPDIIYLNLSVEESYKSDCNKLIADKLDYVHGFSKPNDSIKKLSKSFQFYNLILISEFLSYFDCFYFVKFVDYRGRIYTKGNTISCQGNDMQKALLIFTDNCTLKSEIEINAWKISGLTLYCDIKNETIFLKNFDIFYNSIIKFILSGNLSFLSEAKNPFCFLAFCFEVETFYSNNCLTVDTNMLHSLDASQSSHQISGALSQNENVLEQTNILNTTGSKKDLYKKVGEIIFEKLSKDPLIANQGILSSNFTENSHFIKERKFFKEIVMCFINYGMTNFSFLKDMKSNYPRLGLQLRSLIAKTTHDFMSASKNSEGFFFKQIYLLKFLKNLFKRRKIKVDFNNKNSGVKMRNSEFILKKMDKMGVYKPIRLHINKYIITDIFYTKKKEVIYRPCLGKKQLHFTIKHSMNDDLSVMNYIKEDKAKMQRSVTAHLIHHLDATICIEVLKYFLEKGVPITTNHDCFFVSPKYHKELKSIFALIFYNLLKDPKKIFLKIIEDNKIQLTEKESLFIESFGNSDWQKKLKEIIRSDFFLK